ncbi:class I SAM-dependent methyltransferase [Candidatus Formimonas warabiya]|uniref:Methyltransferase type 11 domain-containing protein n=1 Tax=Formimonas warabiya TaxID=1761012 RepID=A0A3G1KYR5_FORW1|nr:class I SAM-dependent methyltransferase [Candidatus Formimonas warabiya]ATW27602.1 hypothetical protein DCMF_25150 [Candidatus Formimonas warabiya]
MLAERIENYWSGRSAGYSASIRKEISSFRREAWKSLLEEMGGEGNGKKALDVGTGPGFFAILLADLGYEVTALDAAENMLEEARENIKHAGFRATFFKGDAQKVPYPENTFDLIVSRNLTWTLPQPLDTYQEWFRLLKKGGRVLVFDANWYLRLTDAGLQAAYEEEMKLARAKGCFKEISEEQMKECEEIAKKLPLTYQKRPEWDVQAFTSCGFPEVFVQERINERIYNETEQAIYQAEPMFGLCAVK